MSRHLATHASVLLFFFVVAAQSVWVQFVRAPALNASSLNPRNSTASVQYARGEIVAAHGVTMAT